MRTMTDPENKNVRKAQGHTIGSRHDQQRKEVQKW